MIIRHQYLEERAEAVRLAVPLAGWPSTRDAARIARWTNPLVTVLKARISRPLWRTRAQGRSRIVMPRGMPEWHFHQQLFHELAHPLLDVGLGLVAETATDADRAAHPLVRGADRHEEGLADYFVRAIRMPSMLMAEVGCRKEIARITGLSWEVIAQRERELQGQVLNLTWVPYWCAARVFLLEFHPGPEPSLQLRRDGEERPAFFFPTDAGCRHKRELRIKADLVALRPVEFAAKWALYEVREGRLPVAARPERLQVTIAELREWLHDQCAEPSPPELRRERVFRAE